MSRTRIFGMATFAALAIGLAACGADAPADETDAELAGTQAAEPGTDEWKIESAESAAPASVARDAAIMDWPEEEGGEMRELRAGSNGFTCLPDNPGTDGADPMCLDGPWMSWAEAYMSNSEPEIGRIGVSYMLAGDAGVSNIDPYDYDGPTEDNEWVESGPHIMVVAPDEAALEGFPTDPNAGGPYVMWRDTPLAHIMVPIEEPE